MDHISPSELYEPLQDSYVRLAIRYLGKIIVTFHDEFPLTLGVLGETVEPATDWIAWSEIESTFYVL